MNFWTANVQCFGIEKWLVTFLTKILQKKQLMGSERVSFWSNCKKAKSTN